MPGWHGILGSARLASLFDQLPPPRTILEIGPGCWPATPVHFPTTPIAAVDWDGEALQAARRRISHPCFYPVQADAADLPLRRIFDLVVVRHPDLDRHPDRWARVFARIPGALCGILVVTTYSAHEMEIIRPWLRPLVAYPVRYDRLSLVTLDGADRCVVVSQKRSSSGC
ncbi:MAG TPA: hypothetical protein VMT34_08700 [Aggregatilineales bacterium]|nr:hypothetical protein [Aggregatilineales bacterium]